MNKLYYDVHEILPYNALLNFIVGERGVGKTYSCKKFVIQDYLKKGVQFVYLRRYKTELKEACKDFFAGLLANKEFEEHQFKIVPDKNGCVFMCDGEIMGYGLTLSTAIILKSREFPLIRTIIYDEFIIDKGTYKYLQNEVHTFLDIMETIGRTRDIRCLLLGNAVSRTNPYFLYFKINEPYQSTVKVCKKDKNGGNLILFNYIANQAYREMKKNSRFGQLIEGTEYGRYAIDNKWLHENKAFVGKRPEDARFFFIMMFGGVKYGVWSDWRDNKVYISSKYDPSCPAIYTLSNDDHDQNTTLVVARSSSFFKKLLEYYRNGLLYFETQSIKEMILPYINKYINQCYNGYAGN